MPNFEEPYMRSSKGIFRYLPVCVEKSFSKVHLPAPKILQGALHEYTSSYMLYS
jgi:hypothetical protein